MGGMGSGRHWYWGAKDTTDDYRSIDVRRWKRDGLLPRISPSAGSGHAMAKWWPPSACALNQAG